MKTYYDNFKVETNLYSYIRRLCRQSTKSVLVIYNKTDSIHFVAYDTYSGRRLNMKSTVSSPFALTELVYKNAFSRDIDFVHIDELVDMVKRNRSNRFRVVTALGGVYHIPPTFT